MSAIVVGYNGTPEGQAAVRQGIAEARLRQARLVVVYSDHSADPESDRTARRTEAVAGAEQILAGADVEHELRVFEDAIDAVRDVLETAEQVAAELIVIGIRRRSPVGKLILGSHAQAILLESSVPVLAVKA